MLDQIQLDHELLLCDDVECKDQKHKNSITKMYNDIVHSLSICGEPLGK